MLTMWAVVLISSLVFIWQRRIWGRKDCEHEACHPVLCNNCSHWGEEEGGTWQNAGGPDGLLRIMTERVLKRPYVWALLLCFSAGDSGGSDHQCQSPAGGLWQRQDREEWQLLSLCKFLVTEGCSLRCQRGLSVLLFQSLLLCASSFIYNIIFFTCKGKFIRIHFGTTGKLASADIETCE